MNDLFALSKSEKFVIAGPCALESREIAFEVASVLAEISRNKGLTLIFKSSFDKANRTSEQSFRGPGMRAGLEILAEIKEKFKLPVITDIHSPDQAEPVAEVADILQIPAFLCRQTDLLHAAARTGRIVNVKKGQFLAPWDMGGVVEKLRSASCESIWLTERGASFGYNNLVVDMRSIPIMQKTGMPVVFDATHSVQLPGGQGSSSGGQREFVPHLSKAAAACGCDGIFLEVHPNPDCALCDGPNSWPLEDTEKLIDQLVAIWEIS